ncbi:unnamed protein product [Ostreobium quekettii]|uniref:Uncharacterized protein n=1 Tax=Ostreobium quekettii TaxID=121088 RepID=A0A8S1JJ22_9CHLO|nr:unnamed protein product [Ostreobium quekettii]
MLFYSSDSCRQFRSLIECVNLAKFHTLHLLCVCVCVCVLQTGRATSGSVLRPIVRQVYHFFLLDMLKKAAALGLPLAQRTMEFCTQHSRQAACEDLEKAEQLLYDALTEALEPVQRIAERLERDLGVPYMHIDTSLAPGLDTPSMTDSFEALGIGPFGGPGTLAVCSLVTSVLKRIPVRKGGYCGLMLPVCEDAGLSKAAAEGHLRIADLLQYSCFCGCGLDTVPIQGYTGDPVEDRTVEQKIAGIIMDLTALAFRLDKPLSCRLLPQPGKKSGDKTTFQSPYLINSRVMVL